MGKSSQRKLVEIARNLFSKQKTKPSSSLDFCRQFQGVRQSFSKRGLVEGGIVATDVKFLIRHISYFVHSTLENVYLSLSPDFILTRGVNVAARFFENENVNLGVYSGTLRLFICKLHTGHLSRWSHCSRYFACQKQSSHTTIFLKIIWRVGLPQK